MDPIGVDVAGQKSRFGIYVHVPFCTSICSYCDFVKTSQFDRLDADIFFESALLQLRFLLSTSFSSTFQGEVRNSCTLYFGGGTPGLFPAERFVAIISEVSRYFDIEECTIETNPALTTAKRFREFREVGFNRVTIGAQTLCSKTLRTFARRHCPEQALESVSDARNAGFSQAQVDIIYGLNSGERTTRLEWEVAEFVKAGATGVSGYALSLEERTKLFSSKLVSDDQAAHEYSVLRKACLDLGMRQNETSNFSFYEAKHNNIYWYGWPYIAVGTGAHGLLPSSTEAPFGMRYSVGDVPSERAPGDDDLPYKKKANELFEIKWESPRTELDFFGEMVFTLLRTPNGIPWNWLKEIGCPNVEYVWKTDAKVVRAASDSRLEIAGLGLRLLENEFLLGDSWALHLLTIADQVMRDRSKIDRCFP